MQAQTVINWVLDMTKMTNPGGYIASTEFFKGLTQKERKFITRKLTKKGYTVMPIAGTDAANIQVPN